MSAHLTHLVRRAVDGNKDALSAVLQQCAPQLRRDLQQGNAWVSQYDLADVIQITFLEAFLHIRRFDPEHADSFTGWLLRIARNNLRDLQREQAAAKRPPPDKRVGLDSEQSCVALLETLLGTSTTPSRAAAAKEAKDVVTEAVAKLPGDYRKVIQLYDLEGQTIEDTATALGRSVGAAYMLRGRAHDRLREILGSESRFLSRKA